MRVIPALAVAALAWSGLAAPSTPAHAQSGTASVRIEWTAPGDDGNTGTATGYDIRYHVLPISESNFPIAQRYLLAPRPDAAGTKQSVTIPGLTPGMRYYFAIKASDEHGNWSAISNVVSKLVPYNVGVDEPAAVPLSFSAPRPNPARGSATFDFGLPEGRPVSLEVFDLSGRRVRTLALGPQEPGRHSVTWDLRDGDGRTVGAGLYLVRAELGGERFTRRLTVVR